MADLNDALEWLNAFDISHLRDATRERIERLNSITVLTRRLMRKLKHC
jgi:hypothetical protein